MMNEKFMELADQLKWESDVTYGELMRFAALIVRECADISRGIGEHGHIASQEMLDHFGMK